jgi:hypothetical protein
MAAELGPRIQEEHAVVGQRHVARHRHVAPVDEARIRDGVVGRATRAGRDPRRAGAGEARDEVDTRGLDGLGEGHRRQDIVSRGRNIDVPTPRRPRRSRGEHKTCRIGLGRCICQHLELLKILVILAMMAQVWDFRLVPGHPVEPEALITMRPRHGILVTLCQHLHSR